MRFLTYDCRTEEKEALLGLDSRDENDLKDIRENYVQLRMNWLSSKVKFENGSPKAGFNHGYPKVTKMDLWRCQLDLWICGSGSIVVPICGAIQFLGLHFRASGGDGQKDF
ncbi:hypothetical protein PS2_040418 [Malus domestica]